MTVKGNSHRKITEKWLVRTGVETHLKSDIKTVLEAGTELTIKAGGSFIKIDPSGVTINGAKIKLNSGGSPGSGSGARPLLPGDAHLPEIEEAWRPDGDELPALQDSSSEARLIGMPFCATCAPLAEEK
jgi:type VI secretion system secreted protein VgrG